MDYSNVTPRAEPVALSGNSAATLVSAAMSTKAETARPVLAAEAARMATTDTTMKPLDTFKVGDSDYVPVPPEPPRQSTVLAIIADAPKLDVPVEDAPTPDIAPDSAPVEAVQSEAPDQQPEPQAAPATEPLAEALRTIVSGPDNATVDIRR